MSYLNSNIKTLYFSEKIYVKCPKCLQLGIITTSLKNKNVAIPLNYKAQFCCTSCNLTLKESKDWFGLYIGKIMRTCKSCGSNLKFLTKPTKEIKQHLDVSCETCKNENLYEINWEKHLKNHPNDPYFGMDLWLQTAIKSNILWVYNLEHLDFLKDYVASKLREDNFRNKYSLITNLPQWIKDAKNRELIVKKLAKMKSEINKILK